MSKYLKTKEGSIESAVLEAMSPAQQAAIAISKKEKEKEKSENNYIHAAKMAKEKGEKTFTIGGKQYDVEETLKTEKLVGGQKKLDKDKDGDIDGKDFAAMRKAKKEEMDPTDHVKKKGDKFCVYNADGSIAKEFDNKEDADKYAIANHDKMMATAKKEVKESVRPTLAQLAAKHISDMWSEAAKKVEGAEDDTPAYLSGKGKKESKEDETTMTGKPMNKIETKVKDKED